MKSAIFGPAILLALVFGSIGCTLPWGAGGTWFNPYEQVQGPDPLVSADAIEKVDLISEIVPHDKTGDYKNKLTDYKNNVSDQNTDDQKLAVAYHLFYQKYDGNTDKSKIYRNRVQGRLLQASEQRCGEYITFVRQFESEGNFKLGTLTTILAGAGAIVTRVNASRTLSAISAIMSGTRAEFQQAFFSNLATHVIIPAIRSIREDLHKKIIDKRKDDIIKYPIEDAVRDALLYHAHCNLISGIVHAGESIKLAKNPGLVAMEETLNDVETIRGTVARITVLPGSSPTGALDEQQILFAEFQQAEQTLKKVETEQGALDKLATQQGGDSDFSTWKSEIDQIKKNAELESEKAAKTIEDVRKKGASFAGELKDLMDKLKDERDTDQRNVLRSSIGLVHAKLQAERNNLRQVSASLTAVREGKEKLDGFQKLRGRIDEAKKLVNAPDTTSEQINDLAKRLGLSSTGATAKTELLGRINKVEKTEEMDRIAEHIKKVLGKDV